MIYKITDYNYNMGKHSKVQSIKKSQSTKTSTLNEPSQVSKKETEILLNLLDETLPLDGDVVEFGCYKGDTSILFQRRLEQFAHSASRNDTPIKQLWLYDSFAGLPAKTKEDIGANLKRDDIVIKEEIPAAPVAEEVKAEENAAE